MHLRISKKLLILLIVVGIGAVFVPSLTASAVTTSQVVTCPGGHAPPDDATDCLPAMPITKSGPCVISGVELFCEWSRTAQTLIVTPPADAPAVTVYVAAYKLPTTWDGQGWNKSATPQTLFSQQSKVVHNKPVRFNVSLPDCGGIQVDVRGIPFPAVLNWPGLPEGTPAFYDGPWAAGRCKPPTTTTTTSTTAPPRTTTTTAKPKVVPPAVTTTTVAPATVLAVTVTKAPAAPVPVVPTLAYTGSGKHTAPLVALGIGLVSVGLLFLALRLWWRDRSRRSQATA